MEMVYRERWEAEIAEMRRVLAGLAMKEECKWGKPPYTVDGKNIVIMQGFKEYFGLGFFQGALLTDSKKVLVQLGQVHAGRVMKFTSAKDIRAKAATIKAYVREAIAVEKAGLRLGPTASGKTALSLALAERFDGEIVNCDSVAMYREFDIGTAKPAASERARIPHHLVDCVAPNSHVTSRRIRAPGTASSRRDQGTGVLTDSRWRDWTLPACPPRRTFPWATALRRTAGTVARTS